MAQLDTAESAIARFARDVAGLRGNAALRAADLGATELLVRACEKCAKEELHYASARALITMQVAMKHGDVRGDEVLAATKKLLGERAALLLQEAQQDAQRPIMNTNAPLGSNVERIQAPEDGGCRLTGLRHVARTRICNRG